MFRPKDLRNWWSRHHHDRPGGVRNATPTAWTPQSKPIWLTELGCPAVDRGANQPNVFYDPKSSESAVPHFSRGVRDDEMQRRHIQASLDYWSGANNPTSSIYSGAMLDLSHAHVWTWDARPWPDFPARATIWSDASAHSIGHWVTGRLGSAPLADVVAEICAQNGLSDIDVSSLYGVVDGLMADRPLAARDLLEPLSLAFGFDAVERDGRLVFVSRAAAPQIAVDAADLVVDDGRDETPPPLERTRVEASALPRAARLTYIAGSGDYQSATVEATRDSVLNEATANGDLPIALSASSAQLAADRTLAEAWASRDGASFALPPSKLAIEPTDVVRLTTETGETTHRIARISDAGPRQVEALRVDPGHSVAQPTPDYAPTPAVAPLLAAPDVIVMDLPLLTGAETAHAPTIAAFLDPWPGAVDILRSASDNGYAFDARIPRPATIGRTTTALAAAAPHRWTRTLALDIELFDGALLSRDALAVLNGANALAVETPTGDWEIIQFQTATLTAPRAYRLSGLLRRQAGTEPFIADPLPAGARVVILDGAAVQSTMPEADRGLARYYRVGQSGKPIDPQTHALAIHSATAAGLRPYAPAHLRAAWSNGDLTLSWIRRTRVDGDSWEGEDVPLGEESERYRVRLLSGATDAFTATATSPTLTIHAASIPAGAITAAVAQISARIGAGPEATLPLSA